MNCTDSPSSKFSAKDVKVSAELLYQYANLLGLNYEKWTIALRNTAKSFESIPRYRLFKESDGRFCLNYDLAICIVSLAGKTITSAIAHLLMEEAENGKHGEGPDCVNRALGEFASSILQPFGFVEAEKLHRFLEVREDCDSWWCRLKKARKPKAGTDYECVKECSGRGPIGSVSR